MQKRCSRQNNQPTGKEQRLAKVEQRPLIEVFGSRPRRFDLLKRGAEVAGIERGDFVIEVGCASGAGSFFLAEHLGCRMLGVDCDKERIAVAVRTAEQRSFTEASFITGRAEALPIKAGTVRAVVSEASFALLTDKIEAAEEYWRVTKPGGHVIVNDFAIRGEVDEALRCRMRGIPCFVGVQSVSTYRDIFERIGFVTCSLTDASYELIATAAWISKAYDSRPVEIYRIFAGFTDGEDLGKDNSADQQSCEEFFRKARLCYVQLVFRKEAGG